MRYLLDTNACIALLNRSDPGLEARVRRQRVADIGLPAPVAYELYYGAFKSGRPDENLARLDSVGLEIVPFDAADARSAGAVRAGLERSGRPIGPYDVLIAGQARARGLVLITANVREFARVDGLDCEDWSGPGTGNTRTTPDR